MLQKELLLAMDINKVAVINIDVIVVIFRLYIIIFEVLPVDIHQNLMGTLGRYMNIWQRF